MFRSASFLALLAPLSVAAEENWPREIDHPEAAVVVYQPQPETFDGNRLSGRAALSVTPAGESEPIFGVFWFSATVETDRSEDLASISNFRVSRVNWPDSKDTGEQRFTQMVEETLADRCP